jgi:hypothetical protein
MNSELSTGRGKMLPFVHISLIVKRKFKKKSTALFIFKFFGRSGWFDEFRTFHGEGKDASLRQTRGGERFSLWRFQIFVQDFWVLKVVGLATRIKCQTTNSFKIERCSDLPKPSKGSTSQD